MKAIILAAGRGTRLPGGLPKPLREVGGRSMLSCVAEGISFVPQTDTAVVVGYKSELVKQHLGGAYTYPDQNPEWGTGDAVKAARDFLDSSGAPDEPVLVCYADMPLISRATYEELLREHSTNGASCTVLTAKAPNSGLHYGRIVRDSEGVFSAIVEHLDATEAQRNIDELNTGVCVFKKDDLLNAIPNLNCNNEQKEFHLTDVPVLLKGEGKKIATYTIYNSNEIYGVNTPEELKVADEIAKRKFQIAEKRRSSKWFGTGGWRAIIGDDFIKSNIVILAQAVSDDMKSKGKYEIVLGYDRRFLSESAAVWLSEVFAANDITVHFINRIAPTPLVMYTVKEKNTFYGMAVTASHNPSSYNGIKVFSEGGKDADVPVTDVFEGIISQGVTPLSIPFEEGVANGKIKVFDPINDYIDSIIALIDMDSIKGAHLRILHDPMFGVSKTSLQTILMTARCDVDLINDRRDALFGGRLPAPTEETLGRLREMVVEEKYDLGIATDGDADRIGIIDETGRYIHPNEILSLLYYYLLKYKGWKGDVVRNIATTNLLDRIAADFGFKCHEVPVGFKWISGGMEKTGAIIGGESSGGLTIKGHIKGKDGIFASALLVEMLCKTGKTFGELLDEVYGKYGASYMAEFDAKFSQAKKNELQDLLFTQKKIPDFPADVKDVNYHDGCKINFTNNAWIIARFSGTEPLIRVFCEAHNKETAKKYVDIMKKFLGL
ncbi:MAG: NTP transferase domain-containing protein [Oscillospiraceae bacterium]|jgi:alpha-D-glucose phosphate-specific phosphoglucomutase|nr:NTP transferase domain-containing protein [Oscillospiraceae bacterium]